MPTLCGPRSDLTYMSFDLDASYKILWAKRNEIVEEIPDYQDFSWPLIKHAKPVRVYVDETDSCPTVVFRIYIDKNNLNALGKVHGGALTTIIDVLTWNGLLADPIYYELDKSPEEQTFRKVLMIRSVSRKINVRFSRPVDPEGYYNVTTKLLQNSKGGAFISARISNDANKTLVFGIQDLTKLYKPITKL